MAGFLATALLLQAALLGCATVTVRADTTGTSTLGYTFGSDVQGEPRPELASACPRHACTCPTARQAKVSMALLGSG